MIKVDNLSKKYFGYSEVIHHLSFEISDGEKLVIYGAPKSGKTTLLKMLAGIEKPTDGKILIDKININEFPLKSRNTAMVFEDLAIPKYRVVKNILRRPLILRGMSRKDAREKVVQTALDYKITSILDNVGLLLSPYDAVRLAVVRAFMRKPETVLIDNPLHNLNIGDRREYFNTLFQYINNSESTIIYATDNTEELKFFSGRIIILEYGYIKQIGTYAELIDKPDNLTVVRELNNHKINFIEGQIISLENSIYAVIKEKKYKLAYDIQDKIIDKSIIERKVIFGIAAENIRLKTIGDIPCKVQYVRNDGIAAVNSELSENPIYCYKEEDGAEISINLDKVCIFDINTEKSILK